MSFRFSIRKTVEILLTLSVIVLTSCSDFLNEKKQEPQTIELKNPTFVCLRTLPEKINHYIEGTLASADIREGVDCAKESLIYFKNKTRGALTDAYTVEDVRNFFGKYFLKRNNVSPEFAVQLFKMKKVILGGDEKSLTKTEIQKLVDLLDLVKEDAVLLSPHFPILIGKKIHPEWEGIDVAVEKLRATLWVLLRKVDLVNSEYKIDDLKKFFEGLNQFTNSPQSFSIYQKVDKNMDLIKAAKTLVVGEGTRFDNIQDWEEALGTVLQIYKQGLRYHYFMKNEVLRDPKNLNQLIVFIEDTLQIIEESLPMRRHGEISFAMIDNLIDKVMATSTIDSEAVNATYKKVILRLLDPRRQGDARGLNGFEKRHLVALKQEWKSYRLHQLFINQLPFDSENSIGRSELLQAISTFEAKTYIKRILSSNSLEQEALLDSWIQGVKFLESSWPVVFNTEGKVIIVNRPLTLRQTWRSLSRWNLMRSAAMALVHGYGPRLLGVDDLKRWYADFQFLGEELKVFDKRSGNSGARSFNEANLFTFSANGNAVVDSAEAFEFVSLLVSGGGISAEAIRLDMIQQGCALPELDIFEYPWLNENCFKHNLRKKIDHYFNNMPGLVAEISKLNSIEWDSFYSNLMATSRVSSAKGGKVETADLRTAIMILHYTEILMSVYDQNSSGGLDLEEVRLAAPRFLEFMKSVSPVKWELLVEDFFVYLAFKGEKPDRGGYTKYSFERLFVGLGEVSRGKILRVFKVLKDEAAKK